MPKVIQVGDSPKPRRSGQRSGISSPYYDLGSSIKVVQVVHNQGGGRATKDQLAHFLGYSTTKSGAFINRLSAAKMFGLIEIRKNDIFVTELAQKIISPVMPDDEIEAKVAAFLSVQLFQEIYEKFHGQQLPEPVGLKNLLKHHYKIVPDRVTPVLRILMKSADQAGFFDLSIDKKKLIKPTTKPLAPADKEAKPEPDKAPEKPAAYGGGDEPPSGIHTAIIGLLRELPKPGTNWPATSKARFMGAFKATIDFIYPDADDSEETL